MFTNTTIINGALFPIPSQRLRPNGPSMEGWFYVEGEHGKFKGAAWRRVPSGSSSKGQEYLNLQLEPIGIDGNVFKVFGSLHLAEDKRSDSSPDHFGKLNLSADRDGPTLRCSGWNRHTNAEPHAEFISVRIEPHHANAGAHAHEHAEEASPTR